MRLLGCSRAGLDRRDSLAVADHVFHRGVVVRQLREEVGVGERNRDRANAIAEFLQKAKHAHCVSRQERTLRGDVDTLCRRKKTKVPLAILILACDAQDIIDDFVGVRGADAG